MKAHPKSDGNQSALITKEGQHVLPPEIVNNIVSFIGGRGDLNQHVGINSIRLQGYHNEEQAFLAAYPGGDFKAAFEKKYPNMKSWLDKMVKAKNIC